MDNKTGVQSSSTNPQVTPRSNKSNNSGSCRSLDSPSDFSNYSFQQRNVSIPPEIRRVDVAVLSSPLIQQRCFESVDPVGLSDATKSAAFELPHLAADGIHDNDGLKNLKPHPPSNAKPIHRARRRGSQQSHNSQSTSDHESWKENDKNGRRSSNSSRGSLDSPHVSDSEGKNHLKADCYTPVHHESASRGKQSSQSCGSSSSLQESDFREKVPVKFDRNLAQMLRDNFNKQRADIEKRKSLDNITVTGEDIKGGVVVDSTEDSNNDCLKETTPLENVDNVIRKSDEESALINSYENYLRQLSQKEEDCESEISNTSQQVNGTLNDTLADAEDSSTESDSASSNSSISVSSLSDDEQNTTLTLNSTVKSGNKFEPLYSLPIKEKKSNKPLEPVDIERKSLNSSNLSETSQHRYAILNESHNSSELRTQSVPDLRNGRSFRTLDTMGYLCPVIANPEGRNTSSPELKKQNFNLKYRPLPNIPTQNRHSSDEETTGNDETIYEKLQTVDLDSSVQRPKVSLKAVANRLVSLMPRLTTKQARSREADRYMADIMQYLPDQTLRVYCGTWNMKGIKVVPESLDDYILPQESIFIQDIYAIGCQEGTPFRKEWEIRLQETLGPTHVLMYSGNFGVLQLSIFVRRELVWFCSGIEQDTIATRIAHKFKTKGAIAVSFNLFGTSLLFINSHFASNQEKLKERVNDYRTIIRSLNIPFGEDSNNLKEPDVTSRFDRVFWFGDFNFRVERKRSETDEIFANRDFADQDERKMFIVEELKKHDQLRHLLAKGKIFHGLQEAPINFLPTYKFDVNTDTYDTSSKARVPSWTDRILYKSKQPDVVKVIAYNSCTTIKCSDHRPVFCIMETKIEPARKNVQPPGAMFDRDIYIEANLRRSAPRGSQHASNVCIIL